MIKSKPNNITILHLISFFSSLYFYHQIITLYFLQRGLNYVEINSLWGIITASKAIAEVPTGIIGDKIGKKFSIIMASALQLAGEIIFIFADRYLLFVLTSVIGGIGFAFLSDSFEAIMYDSLKKESREGKMQKVVGLNASFSQMAIIIGSSVGGFITLDLRLNNFILVIVMTAFFVGIALLVSILLKEPTALYGEKVYSSLELFEDGMMWRKPIVHYSEFSCYFYCRLRSSINC